MPHKCHKCEAVILVLRLGYCMNCKEPISSEILPDAKKQALAQSEQEYEAKRDLIREKKASKKWWEASSDDNGLDIKDFFGN